LDPIRTEWSIDADAKEAIDDQIRGQRKQRGKLREVSTRIFYLEQINPAFHQMLTRATSIVPVVALAHENQHSFPRLCVAQNPAGQRLTHPPDDFGLGLPHCPRRPFPLSHLRDSNDWQRHTSRVWFGDD